MKLTRFLHFLNFKQSLTNGLVLTFLTLASSSMAGNLSGDVVWEEGNAPGYSATSGFFKAIDCEWEILSGSYEAICTYAYGSIEDRIYLDNSTLYNSGMFEVKSESTTTDALGAYAYGAKVLSNSSLINEREGVLSVCASTSAATKPSTSSSNATYPIATALRVYGNFNNKGTVRVEAHAPGSGGEANGIIVNGGNFSNRGLIEVTASTPKTAGTKGIWLNAGVVLTNEYGGKIIISNGEGSRNDSSIAVVSSSSLTNKGTIDAKGGIKVTTGATLLNESSGLINLSGVMSAYADDTRFYVYGGNLNNKGQIISDKQMLIQSFSTNYTASVLNSGLMELSSVTMESGSLTNNSLGEIDAKSLTIRKSTAYNYGKTTTSKSINIQYNANFYNYGVLNTNEITIAYKGNVYIEDDSTLALLDGETLIVSEGSDREYGVRAGTLTLGNIAVNSALSISGVTLNADGTTLKMGGDLSIMGAYNFGSGGLTVDNGENVNSVKLGTSLATSWNNAFTLHGENVITQCGVKDNVVLQGGSVTLGDGKLEANESLNLGGRRSTEIYSDTDTLNISSGGDGTVSNTYLTAENINLSAGSDDYLTLDNSTLTIEGGRGEFTNVRIMSNSSIISSSVPAELTFNNVVYAFSEEEGILAYQPLTLNLDENVSAISEETNVYTLNCAGVQNVNVSGDLTLDLSLLADDILNGGYNAVSVYFDNSVSFTPDAQVFASLNGVDYALANSMVANGVLFSVDSLKNSSSIPEPATATLSLLALAGLAARRRRK